jgi:dienelactone hydrolase
LGERITFDRPDGGECPAYYVQPDAGDGAPGVVYSRSGGAWTNTLGTSRLAWRRAAIERLFPTSTGAR